MKFGIPILRDLRTTALPYWNRKLIRDVNGRHLENCYDIIHMPMTIGR